MITSRRWDYFIALVLVAITVAVFGQTKSFEFLNFDDTIYITQNATVQSGLTRAGIARAFTRDIGGMWHPLSCLSHMVDCHFFGMDSAWPHTLNMLFHMANTLLLFFILNGMTKATWRSALVATLFAVHPLHVESVAWVAERKDVLSTFFWMLTMGAYGRYAKESVAGGCRASFAAPVSAAHPFSPPLAGSQCKEWIVFNGIVGDFVSWSLGHNCRRIQDTKSHEGCPRRSRQSLLRNHDTPL